MDLIVMNMGNFFFKASVKKQQNPVGTTWPHTQSLFHSGERTGLKVIPTVKPEVVCFFFVPFLIATSILTLLIFILLTTFVTRRNTEVFLVYKFVFISRVMES